MLKVPLRIRTMRMGAERTKRLRRLLARARSRRRAKCQSQRIVAAAATNRVPLRAHMSEEPDSALPGGSSKRCASAWKFNMTSGEATWEERGNRNPKEWRKSEGNYIGTCWKWYVCLADFTKFSSNSREVRERARGSFGWQVSV